MRQAQASHEKIEETGIISEHFYQKISDQYGRNFSKYVDSLILELPQSLNFDQTQLSLDEDGVKLIDEAIRWNHSDWQLFDKWFPSVLAYYGEYYIKHRKNGRWGSIYNEEYKIWIPQIILDDGTSAFDMVDFYKNLLESPTPMKQAGDFDGKRKEFREKLRRDH